MPARTSSSKLTTPSALSKVASRNFITRAATPPVPGGEHPRMMTFAHPKNLFKKTKFYTLVTQRHKDTKARDQRISIRAPLCLCASVVISEIHSSVDCHRPRSRRSRNPSKDIRIHIGVRISPHRMVEDVDRIGSNRETFGFA